MSKPTINYWIDIVIGAAFVASAASGIVFLLPFPMDSVLGLSYPVWDTIHTWGSLLMIGGVIAHLALHWKWLTYMTRKTLLPDAPLPRRASAPDTAGTDRRGFLRLAGYTALVAGVSVAGYELLGGRRSSSAAAGVATLDDTTISGDAPVVQAAPAVGQPAAVTATQAAEGADAPVSINITPTSTPAPAVQSRAASSRRVTVACRKGQVNCPFPGRCHSYRDTNGNGYCDLSQPV